MGDLHHFKLPPQGHIVFCEIEGQIQSGPPEANTLNIFVNVMAKYPKIHITRDMLHMSKCATEDCNNMFLPVAVPFCKEVIQTYYEQGLRETLRLIASRERGILSPAAALILAAIAKFRYYRPLLDKHLGERRECQLSELIRTAHWGHAPIKAIAWHYDTLKIAVAASDDTVRLFTVESNLVPVLKCKQQHNIVAMAWRPMSSSCLAIACERCIIIWDVDPSSVVTRPSINNCIFLSRPNHVPIVDLCWNPYGDVLVTVAARDRRIMMWNVELNQTEVLKRPSGSGTCLVRWSPNSRRMLTATNSYVFHIWNCNNWDAERWAFTQGPIRSACWTPCSSVLLFITENNPIIYALSFIEKEMVFQNDSNGPNAAASLYDLTKVEIDDQMVGGDACDIQIDPNGMYLAVLFMKTRFVALFKITIRPMLQLVPNCLINGLPDELPCAIAFQPTFEHGSCLTIGWSSGRLQYFPIVYSRSPSNNLFY